MIAPPKVPTSCQPWAVNLAQALDPSKARDTIIKGTPKVCTIMAFWAIFRGFGQLFYLLWGFRYYHDLYSFHFTVITVFHYYYSSFYLYYYRQTPRHTRSKPPLLISPESKKCTFKHNSSKPTTHPGLVDLRGQEGGTTAS